MGVHLITPIYKSGEKSSANNYRPISQLCFVSKVLEKIIFDKIIGFVVDHIWAPGPLCGLLVQPSLDSYDTIPPYIRYSYFYTMFSILSTTMLRLTGLQEGF